MGDGVETCIGVGAGGSAAMGDCVKANIGVGAGVSAAMGDGIPIVWQAVSKPALGWEEECLL